MPKFAAYILTSTNVPERVSDARDLKEQLESLKLFDLVECIPSIFWNDEASIPPFLSRHPEHTFDDEYLDRALQGQVCCTLSHLMIWHQLLESNFEGAVIFEDDVYVSDFEMFGEIIRRLPDHSAVDWLRIHLHKHFRVKILDESSPLDFVDDPSLWGNAAYWVSRAGARKLVSEFKNIDAHVDKIIPRLGRNHRLDIMGLDIKVVNKDVLAHHAFEGDNEELLTRHPREREKTKIQRQASTIYSTPELTRNDALSHFVSTLANVQALRRDGITVLEGLFDAEIIQRIRSQVLEHQALYSNTRPTPSSRHLASFHRYPELEALHGLVSSHPKVLNFLKVVLGGESVRSIGLSDITINRSQQWHMDLLRGKYETYLAEVDIWGRPGADVFKVMMYLQDGDSLQIIPGSHLVPMSLERDDYAEPGDADEVMAIPVKAGDIAVMDIRTSHRGSTEEDFATGAFDANPRILISTALGRDGAKLTDAMEFGNGRRLMDWQAKHRKETPLTRPRDISSRSHSVNANRDRR